MAKARFIPENSLTLFRHHHDGVVVIAITYDNSVKRNKGEIIDFPHGREICLTAAVVGVKWFFFYFVGVDMWT